MNWNGTRRNIAQGVCESRDWRFTVNGVRGHERRSKQNGVKERARPHERHTLTETRPQLLPPTLKMAAPFMEKIAEYFGSPEPAIRLILSVLLGKWTAHKWDLLGSAESLWWVSLGVIRNVDR